MAGRFEALVSGLRIADGPEECQIFVGRLEDLVRAGGAKRMSATRIIHTRDEEWYVDPESGETYVYVPPDDKILPIWEPIDIFAEEPEKESNNLLVTGLRIIQTGEIDRETALGLRMVLEEMVSEGLLERLGAIYPKGRYREYSTDAIYCLIDDPDNGVYRWERESESDSVGGSPVVQ